MKRILALESIQKIGEKIKLSGWASNVRDHGGLIFIELRDWSGVIQLIVDASNKQAYEIAKEVGLEYVISITGTVKQRDEKLVNKNIQTGSIEVEVESINVLNKSKPLPFPLTDDGREIEENTRLKYRYVDLRRKRVKETLQKRHEIISFTRNWFAQNQFTEIETPLLTVSTPEGARDFLVPSRIYKGKFFALPQSPQQYKQLLMVGGIHRYFQIAPCFRDEDPRADRHSGAFYQIDAECSFVETPEEFFEIVEPYLKDVTQNVTNKRIQQYPIPRIKYKEAWDKYGSDKPDLRFKMHLVELTEIFKSMPLDIFKTVQSVKGVYVNKEFTRSQIDELTQKAKLIGAKGLAYITFTKEGVSGPLAKYVTEEIAQRINEQLVTSEYENTQEGTLFVIAGEYMSTCTQMGVMRSHFGDILGLKDKDVLAFAWIVDFDMFEYNEQEGRWDFSHNPFSMPQGGLEELKTKNPSQITASQYDIACNGYEVASGSIRNFNPEVFIEAFKICGYSPEETKKKFGHMISAFEYGAPPHGGFAIGIDRFIMILTDETNIREIYAFPQTNGQELMVGSPSAVDKKDLDILGIKLKDEGREIADRILSMLRANSVDFKHLAHAPATTSQESAKIRGTNLSDGLKAMVLTSKEYSEKNIVIVIPADKELDLERVKHNLSEEYLIASQEYVQNELGLEIGGVPPFARLLRLDLYFDKQIFDKEVSAFNIGLKTESVICSTKDVIRLANPDIKSREYTFTK